ncbi:hypothetical protein PHLH5_41260 [Pseudomonas sp. Cab53]|nr:hypothetical protein PHLH5_41260 [Pseudomonas sp. Cab53]
MVRVKLFADGMKLDTILLCEGASGLAPTKPDTNSPLIDAAAKRLNLGNHLKV